MGGKDSGLVCGAPCTAFGLCFAEGMNEDGACTLLHKLGAIRLLAWLLRYASPQPSLEVERQTGTAVPSAERRTVSTLELDYHYGQERLSGVCL